MLLASMYHITNEKRMNQTTDLLHHEIVAAEYTAVRINAAHGHVLVALQACTHVHVIAHVHESATRTNAETGGASLRGG